MLMNGETVKMNTMAHGTIDISPPCSVDGKEHKFEHRVQMIDGKQRLLRWCRNCDKKEVTQDTIDKVFKEAETGVYDDA